MYIVEADIRDANEKPRRLRKNGFTPCCLYGGGIDRAILLQMPEGESKKLIRSKDIGGRVDLMINGEKYNALIKDLATDILTNKVVHIGFQNIKKGEVVNSTAQVVYINHKNQDLLVMKLLEEIPYKAKAENLIEEVIIDLSDVNEPCEFMLSDLSIYSDENIDIMLDEENPVVLNIVPNIGEVIEEPTEEDEDYVPPTVAETEEDAE